MVFEKWAIYSMIIIPNTAVFGPTNFIETIASTTKMTVYADENVHGFLNLDF